MGRKTRGNTRSYHRDQRHPSDRSRYPRRKEARMDTQNALRRTRARMDTQNALRRTRFPWHTTHIRTQADSSLLPRPHPAHPYPPPPSTPPHHRPHTRIRTRNQMLAILSSMTRCSRHCHMIHLLLRTQAVLRSRRIRWSLILRRPHLGGGGR